MSRPGLRSRDFFTSATVLCAAAAVSLFWLLLLPATSAQAGLSAFLWMTVVWLWLVSRHLLDGVWVEREHPPRVFQDDRVEVCLRVHRGKGAPIQMLQVRDLFQAALDITQHDLLPLLSGGWVVQLAYLRHADRHRGLYLLGPVRLLAADPLGVFLQERQLDCLTRLTIYPHADALPDYTLPGPDPGLGASMNQAPRIGQGEEILGLREYAPGDPPASVHWRTSARRGRLHVIQRNCPIQCEVAVLMDLTRRSRFGLGGESTAELAILAATSILTCAHETRHRSSLGYAHKEPVHFPSGSGLAHLHLLLDRLAILNPDGETDFWAMAGARALVLPRGSRAVAISVAANTPLEAAVPLIARLTAAGVGVDWVLIDEQAFIRIYPDQETDMAQSRLAFLDRAHALRQSGARVFLVRRGQPPPILGPAVLAPAGQGASFFPPPA